MEQSPTISEVFPIPAEAKRLEVFLGDWDVEGTVTFGGNAMKAKGRWAFRKAAGGWGLKATMKVNLEGIDDFDVPELPLNSILGPYFNYLKDFSWLVSIRQYLLTNTNWYQFNDDLRMVPMVVAANRGSDEARKAILVELTG